MNRTLGDYDVWHKPCAKCGFDSGKACQKTRGIRKGENNPRCWKCGERIERDFSDRALKDPAAEQANAAKARARRLKTLRSICHG